MKVQLDFKLNYKPMSDLSASMSRKYIIIFLQVGEI